MEDKKYEAGRVEISSAEYRDLVTEAVANEKAASDARSEKWKVEDERNKLKKELESARARIAELEGILQTLQIGVQHQPVPYNVPSDAHNPKPWWSEVTCTSHPTATLSKED